MVVAAVAILAKQPKDGNNQSEYQEMDGEEQARQGVLNVNNRKDRAQEGERYRERYVQQRGNNEWDALLCFAAQAPRLLSDSRGLLLLLCWRLEGYRQQERHVCIDRCLRVSVSDSHSRPHHQYQHSRVELFITTNDKRENRTKRPTQPNDLPAATASSSCWCRWSWQRSDSTRTPRNTLAGDR